MQILKTLSHAALFPDAGFPVHQATWRRLERYQPKVDPCTDFYEYANGTWRANNPIPAEMSRWSKRWQSGETSKDKLRGILEEAEQAKDAPKGSSAQLIGDFYAACTNQARIDARGYLLKPWFAKIDNARDLASLQPVLFELHDVAVAAPFIWAAARILK